MFVAGCPRITCNKSFGRLFSVSVILTKTMSNAARTVLRSPLFQCPRLGAARTNRRSGGVGLPLGGLPALRGRASQRHLSTQATRFGAGVERRCAAVQFLLRHVSATCDARVGSVLRPPFPGGSLVRDGRRTGLGTYGAPWGDHAPVGDPCGNIEAMAAVVAGDFRGYTDVAGPARWLGETV